MAPPISETVTRLSNTDDIHAHIAAAHVDTIQKFGREAVKWPAVGRFCAPEFVSDAVADWAGTRTGLF
jgi:hypothetical protein